MKVARIFNTNLHLDPTALVLFFMISQSFYVYFWNYTKNFPVTLFAACTMAVCMILSIIAHEFGHIFVGRKFGVNFNDVYIHLFGGAAVMSNMVETAKGECLMALAGPTVSFALAVASITASWLCIELTQEVGIFARFLGILGTINLVMGCFNLIPAFPLDGGRVLRSAIWKATGSFLKATEVAAFTGKLLGGVFICSGLMMVFGFHIPYFGSGIGSGIWQALIGFLVIRMATSELKMARLRHGL